MATAALADGVALEIAMRPMRLRSVGTDASFVPGEAGLETLRLECRFSTPWDLKQRTTVRFVDSNEPERAGWREVTATGEGATLIASDVPNTSPSRMLQAYPDGRLDAPLDIRSATLTVGPGEQGTATRENAAGALGGGIGVLERLA